MLETNGVRRVARGALWGLLATLAMSAFILIGAGVGSAPELRPLPLLVASKMLRHGGAAAVVLAIAGQLGLGAAAGLIFAYLSRPMTLAKGIAYGLFLWFAVGETFVAWIGWGDMGLLRDPWVAAYQLVLHLIYGAVLGSLGARDESRRHATFDVLGRLQPHQGLRNEEPVLP